MSSEMEREEDAARITFRLPVGLKDWVGQKGGARFLRKLLLIAYRNLEKKEFPTLADK